MGESSAVIVAPFHKNGYLEGVTSPVYGFQVPDVPNTKRLVKVANLFASSFALRGIRPDILHETYYSSRGVTATCPRVITVFDMINEKFPGMFRENGITAEKKAAVMRADHLICISEQTRRDLIELLNVDPQKTSVVYLGHAPFQKMGAPLPLDLLRPYILYVGNRAGYKNFETLARAFAKSRAMKEGMGLVCFGGGDFSAFERRLLKELKYAESQVQHFEGGDAILSSLYSNAELFVYPSLYEGFGIPPLEAMSCGCPVACSNTSSIPEVVGDAAELFDPEDLGSISMAIDNVLNSVTRKNILVKKGRKRLEKFSWDVCAYETFRAYKAAL